MAMDDTMSGLSGGEWIFGLIVLLALFNGGFGGMGNGAYRGAEGWATQADIQRAVDLTSLQRGQADIMADVQRTNYEQIAAMKDAAYNNLSEIRDVQNSVTAGFAEMQKCCCETLRAIDGINYNGAINTAAIQATDTANTQKILDAISTNRIADMQNQINGLQLQLATAGMVRYPMGMMYNAGASPFCGNNGCGCNYANAI